MDFRKVNNMSPKRFFFYTGKEFQKIFISLTILWNEFKDPNFHNVY